MSDRAFLRRIQKAMQGVLGDSTKDEPKVNIIKSVNVEEQKTVEVVYKPDDRDVHDQWMTEETIAQGEESFRGNEVTPNLYHIMDTDQFEVTKSWVLPEDTTYEIADSEFPSKTLKKGTWVAEVHYKDSSLWELKKSKELGGLSLGGYGDVNEETGEITNLSFSAEDYLKFKDESK